MDIKLKNYSHLMITKIIAFIMVIICFTGVMTAFVNVAVLNNDDFEIVFEDNYFKSKSYVMGSDELLAKLTRLMAEYKSEDNILKGGTIDEYEMRDEEERLYSHFREYSRSFNPELGRAKNYEVFKAEYADKITQAKEALIKNDLKEYNMLLQRLKEYKEPLFYASNGVNVLTNNPEL